MDFTFGHLPDSAAPYSNHQFFPLSTDSTPTHWHPPTLPPFSAISRPSLTPTVPNSSIRTTHVSEKDSNPDPVLPPVQTVRERRLAREKEEKEEKRRKQVEKRKVRQKKADTKYHGNLREALEELKDTLSEGPGECPTTISEVYIAAGEAVIKLHRQDCEIDPDEEDFLSRRAGEPPHKSNHRQSTASDSEESDDRPSKRRRRSDHADGAKAQRQAESNYREHRSDALRWLSNVVMSYGGVCKVIHEANESIKAYRADIRVRGESPVA
ncbi:hypothetical protein SISNIDRAFT_490685 [Sistotremastrum niveocremeum HHB9708]|uniref:Uncharacterized protein n=1 Tax=Sistotremastrum niveocremeum HHB9708 TaxID=1314777 RepID=A0A164NNL8_9AGAM|nr:hypothetical protein SISNIDRAFT_490685 [Sistotremastrum niveocremeum HHB9708]